MMRKIQDVKQQCRKKGIELKYFFSKKRVYATLLVECGGKS